MKGIVLYKSKYGATKKYAGWLSELTGFATEEISKTSITQMMEYDTIILCGGIYASGIAGLPFFRKNMNELREKKLAIFCVGASPYEEDAFNQIKQNNLKEDMKDVPMFYGRGAWNEEGMNFKDRTLCKLLQKAVSKKEPKDYEIWEKALMCAVGQKCDWTDKKYLEPVIQYINA